MLSLVEEYEISSNQLEKNLSGQKVSRYFSELGSVSNSTNRRELMDLWFRMWSRSRVRVVPFYRL
jgi:hypothetical protein